MTLLGICSVVIRKYRHLSDNKLVIEKNISKQDIAAIGLIKSGAMCTSDKFKKDIAKKQIHYSF